MVIFKGIFSNLFFSTHFHMFSFFSSCVSFFFDVFLWLIMCAAGICMGLLLEFCRI